MQLFIQMVYAQDCNLNNNGVIHPETIVQQRSDRPSLYYVEGIQVKKTDQRQAPVVARTTLLEISCRGSNCNTFS